MTEIDTGALTKLKNLIGGDSEDLAEFIDDFARISPEMVNQMMDGSGSTDWDSVKIAAHSLKSNSQDLGAVALSQLCAVMEKESATGAVENPQEKIATIAAEAQGAIQALRSLDLSTL